MTKIGGASEDGVTISHHFGRSRCFLIYEIEDKKIVGQSMRDNTFTAFARGECHHEAEPHVHHGHEAAVQALADCEVILCYGMGWRAAEELKQNGIQAFVLPSEMPPEEDVRTYLAGNLPPAGEFCRCPG